MNESTPTCRTFIMEDIKLPSFLSDALISSLPDSAFYIPNFISTEEEETLLHKVYTSRS